MQFTTDYYAPAYERIIAWDDQALGKQWLDGVEPNLYAKGAKGQAFTQAEVFA